MIRAVLISVVLFILGCTGTLRHQSAQVVPEQFSLKKGEYRINPYDILEISVYQEEDLTKLTKVSSTGNISLPLLGQTRVAGLTVSEVEKKVTKLLEKDYLVNPQVTVFIKGYHSNKVSILGAIRNPGTYKIPQEKPLTILEVVSKAGGFTNEAARNKLSIIRLENGIEKKIEVNTKKITKKGDRSKDVILKPDDIIFVPERFF